MRISGNALGIFPRRKHVLTQIQDRDVSMMGMFGEEIQDALVAAPFVHQVVHDQETPLRKPFDQVAQLGNPFVKLDALFFHPFESILPGTVTIMDGLGRGLKQIQIVT